MEGNNYSITNSPKATSKSIETKVTLDSDETDSSGARPLEQGTVIDNKSGRHNVHAMKSHYGKQKKRLEGGDACRWYTQGERQRGKANRGDQPKGN